jgi:predicted O-methyltransferase YrrM
MLVTENCPVLREMIATDTTLDAQGQTVPFHSGIYPHNAEALHRLVLAERPTVVVEIGMAQGVSTLAILSALERNGGNGELISIDPFQSSGWGGCGYAAVARAGLKHRHKPCEEMDWQALPRLAAQPLTVDLAYIDGSHAFDYVLLDTFYLDRMLRVGGVLGFNDCGLEAVDKVLRYLLSHRRYAEIDVGLPFVRGRPFGFGRALRNLHRNPAALPAALWRTRKLSALWRPHQDRYFRKVGTWEPTTDIDLPF